MRPTRILTLAMALAATTVAGTACAAGDGSDGILVAAASDLRVAFEDLGERFEAATGTSVTFSFGSSGQLKEQLLQGAPFDVFASADIAFVDEVIEAGRGDPATRTIYAVGRIVVWSPDGTIEQLADLADPSIRAIAIANPEHAPYGLAAQQALADTGVLDEVRPRLVLGENISDTLRLATSGNADAAIAALSLVIPRAQGGWSLVPEEHHDRLEQALVLTAADPARVAAAQAFVDLVGSDAGRAVMRSYGFTLPGDPDPDPAEP